MKPRDIDPAPKPIRLQGKAPDETSYLSTEGDFRVLDMGDLPDSPGVRLCKLVEGDQTRSTAWLAREAGVTEKKVKEYLLPFGWEMVGAAKGKSGHWERSCVGSPPDDVDLDDTL